MWPEQAKVAVDRMVYTLVYTYLKPALATNIRAVRRSGISLLWHDAPPPPRVERRQSIVWKHCSVGGCKVDDLLVPTKACQKCEYAPPPLSTPLAPSSLLRNTLLSLVRSGGLGGRLKRWRPNRIESRIGEIGGRAGGGIGQNVPPRGAVRVHGRVG